MHFYIMIFYIIRHVPISTCIQAIWYTACVAAYTETISS